MQRKSFFLASFATFGALCGVAFAQVAQKGVPPKIGAPRSALLQPSKGAAPVAAPKAVAPKAPAAQAGDIRIRNSTDGTAVYDNKHGISRISKNVVVTQDGEDFILYCDEITYNENTNEAIARGNVRLQSRDSTLTGTLIRADFDTKVITVLGDVVMNSHGKGDGIRSQNDFKHKPSQIDCDRIDYNYENRQATVTGNIRMTQEQNTGTCSRIVFDEERNVAQLDGTVLFRNETNKRTIRAEDVTVWIDEDMVETKKSMSIKSQNQNPRPVRPTASSKDFAPVPTLPPDLAQDFTHPLPPPPAPAPAKNDDDTPPPAEPAKPSTETDKS